MPTQYQIIESLAQIHIRELTSARHFDICPVRKLCKLYDVSTSGPDFETLRLMHCVKYSDMDQTLRTALRDSMTSLFGVYTTAAAITEF